MLVKRAFTLLLLAVLCFALLNCGGTTGSSDNSGGNNSGGNGGGSSSTSEYVYAVNGSSLVGYKVSSGGMLEPIANLQSSNQLRYQYLSASPDGRFLYSFQNPCIGSGNCGIGVNFNQDNQVLVQSVASDGTLDAPKGVVNGDQLPIDVKISPNGKYAFVLSGATLNKVTVYAVNSDGTFGASTGSVQLPQPNVSDIEGGRAYPMLGGFTGGNILWVGEIISYRSGSEPSLISIRFDPDTGAVVDHKVKDLITISEVESLATTSNKVITAEGMAWSFIKPNTTTVWDANNGDPQLQKTCTLSNDANCGRNVQMTGSLAKPFVFAINYPENVGDFRIVGFRVGDDGSLTSSAGTQTFASGSFSDLDVDTAAKFLFVTNRDSKTLTVMSIDQSSAAVSVTGTATTSDAVGAVASVIR